MGIYTSRFIKQLRINNLGASKEIREAIARPTDENESAAWNALQPLVLKLRTFFDFSKELNVIVPKILMVLCSNIGLHDGIPPANPAGRAGILEQLECHQALVKQFAKILDFVLRFDEVKMTTPAVQNDFSYYRRTVQRKQQMQRRTINLGNGHANNGNGNERNEADIVAEFKAPIPVDVGNTMSLFFAHATPMLNALSEVVGRFVREKPTNVGHNTTETLSVMAKVCQKMLDTPDLKGRFKYEDTELFILRVMVATVILYDHVDETGAFAKGASVDVKGCVKVLKEYDKAQSESLMNALRYTTKHLNDESTPKSTKSLLFDDYP